ncbi:MAG TPA: D-alanyl-D-alanine carboxypeptidase/D-alanyl-D-alanine-endopeptidase [Actinomycetales bacterium]|nr:D-alanyl-D-alanine carboxypeptidase/D-alanyl-D-alanine-endopeptidase [Actinomycetales bacterium]
MRGFAGGRKVALAALFVVVVVAGYATADAVDVVPGVITLSGPRTVTGDPRPVPSMPPHSAAPEVLGAVGASAPVPVPAAVAASLAPLVASPALGPAVSAYVVDAVTGDVLFDAGGSVARTPASTTKLLTAAAVLTTVGPQTTLPTRVVQGAAPDEIVLVGSGDMLLGTGPSDPSAVVGRAGLATLAEQTAARLKEAGTSRVALRVDDTAFAGPTVSPAWDPADVAHGYTGRVAAIGLARDRARPGHAGPVDPALSAGRAFVSALGRAGISVAGPPVRTTAPDQATVLGEVRSAPVADILGVTLRESDNALAEVLGRLAARSMGRPPTFEDTALAVVDEVERLGIDTGATHLVDVSGLGDGTVIPARVLVDVLRLATSADHPQLRSLLADLPVAGFNGTLAGRFTKGAARAAAGLLRAKTGTLTGVSSLAGYVVDDDGRLLLFAVMADHVPAAGTLDARQAVDRVGAVLSGCGCR